MEGVKEDRPEAIALLGPEPRLRPQRLLSIMVPDSKVKTVVDALITSNQSGNPGDGKIFVMPATDAYRVRTGESGDSVLD